MARSPSKGSGSRKSRSKAQDSVSPEPAADDSIAAEETLAPEDSASAAEDGDLGGDTVLVGETAMGEDSVAPEPEPGERVTIEPGDTTASEDPAQTEIVEDAPAKEEPVAAAAPAAVIEQRGPGAGSLIFGGVVAAALGFGAAYLGFGSSDTDVEPATDPALTAALEQIEAQSATIAGLEEQVAALASAEAPAIPEVDLSGVEGAIGTVQGEVTALAGIVTGIGENVGGLDGALTEISGRVAALEDRPVFTGEVDEDSAAMAAAVEALEARLNTEREAAAEAVAAAEAAQAAAAAELQAASDAAQAAIAEAEARAAAAAEATAAEMAAAEARAAETVAATQAQAALSRIRIAMAAGDPFADALADFPAEAPDALAAVAESGVPTNEELQGAFPAAARAALPIALRETAGDTVGDRLGAFLLGQVGGRSTEPLEGDGPDAVLSRAEAAVASGDVATALTEIAALPEGAQAALADWISLAETRAAADAALAELAAALDN